MEMSTAACVAKAPIAKQEQQIVAQRDLSVSATTPT